MAKTDHTTITDVLNQGGGVRLHRNHRNFRDSVVTRTRWETKVHEPGRDAVGDISAYSHPGNPGITVLGTWFPLYETKARLMDNGNALYIDTYRTTPGIQKDVATSFPKKATGTDESTDAFTTKQGSVSVPWITTPYPSTPPDIVTADFDVYGEANLGVQTHPRRVIIGVFEILTLLEEDPFDNDDVKRMIGKTNVATDSTTEFQIGAHTFKDYQLLFNMPEVKTELNTTGDALRYLTKYTFHYRPDGWVRQWYEKSEVEGAGEIVYVPLYPSTNFSDEIPFGGPDAPVVDE